MNVKKYSTNDNKTSSHMIEDGHKFTTRIR